MLSVGLTTVTITDANQDQVENEVSILTPTQIEDNLIQLLDPSCSGGNDGSIVIDPMGGTGDLSLSWSTGETSNSISNLTAGPYTVIITDENNCEVQFTYEVSDPTPITDNLVSLNNPACFDENTGSISVDPMGGTGALSLLWYTLVITDDNNCEAIFTYEIVDPAAITDNLISLENPSCFGDSNGSIMVDPMGGTGVLTLSWNNGEISNSLTNLAPGVYTLLIQDQFQLYPLEEQHLIAIYGILAILLQVLLI